MNKIIFIVMLLCSPTFASLGGIVGNGSDFFKSPQVWFLGTSPIQACIEVSPDFPFAAKMAMAMVDLTVRNWREYLKSKSLASNWYLQIPFINFNIRFSSSCRGHEALTIYFGGKPARVRPYLEKFQDPRGFEVLEDYDAKTGVGRGFIWISEKLPEFSFLTGPDQILTILMHEFGHILGCGHVAGTIMREDLAQFIRSATPLVLTPNEMTAFPTVMDHTKELFFALDRGVKALQPIETHPDPAQIEIFKLLLGRSPEGPVWMGFIQGHGAHHLKGSFYVADESGEFFMPQSRVQKKLRGRNFAVEFDEGSRLPFSTSDQKIFRVVFKDYEHTTSVPGYILHGVIRWQKPDGSPGEIPIDYIRNRGSGEYVRLLFTAPGQKKKQEFFRALLKTQPYW